MQQTQKSKISEVDESLSFNKYSDDETQDKDDHSIQ